MRKLLIMTGLCLLFILGFSLPAAKSPADLTIKSDKPDIKLSLFTREEQAWIQTQRDTVFYVGVAQDYVPIEYLDDGGSPRGMGIELLKKVHQLTGLTFKLYPDSKRETWEEILQSTIAQRIDVLSTVSFTPGRGEYLEFSLPYMETTQVIVGDKDATQLFRDVAQIKGDSTFAVPRGYWFLDTIERKIPQAGIIEVENMEEALEYVTKKKADYTVCETPVFTYYKEQGLYKDIKIVGELEEKNQIFIGVRKGHRQLIPIVNKVIQHINSDEIYETSMVIPRNHSAEKRLIVLVGLLIVVVYSLWRTFKKLVRSKKAAEQANLDKTRLMASISHDLRTPLTVILGYAQALTEGQVKSEVDKARYIRKISEKVRYLNAIVDDFFLSARLEDNNLTLNREPVRIDCLLRQIIEDAELNARSKQITISLNVADGAAVYKPLDAVKLYRAVENVMSNAIAYTGKGGRIEVSAVPSGQGKVEIAIKDNGQGIDPADIPYIFDRYYKGKQARKESIGLGLFIAREILRKHQGEIRVESEPGQGSVFYLVL